MKPKRPVFLDLWRIKLPAMGLASILHRVSGVLHGPGHPALGAHLFHQSLARPGGICGGDGDPVRLAHAPAPARSWPGLCCITSLPASATWPWTSAWGWSARRPGAAPRS